MNTEAFVFRMAKRAVLVSGLFITGLACAANPVDPVSNPRHLGYPEVKMELPDYDEPFQRDGVMRQPERFKQMVPGITADDVLALIGRPLNESEAAQGGPWQYNFTFQLPGSQNYIVCQYKVLFDQSGVVEGQFWRRHQCLDIVNGAAG